MPFYGKKLGMVQYVYGSWQPVHCVISAKWLGFMYTHIWPFEMALVGESTALTKHDISIMLRHFSNNIALNHSGRKPKTERRVCVYIPSPEMYSSVCIYIYIYIIIIYIYIYILNVLNPEITHPDITINEGFKPSPNSRFTFNVPPLKNK